MTAAEIITNVGVRTRPHTTPCPMCGTKLHSAKPVSIVVDFITLCGTSALLSSGGGGGQSEPRL